MTADQYGLDGPLFVHAPGQPRRLAAHAAGFNATFAMPQSSEKAAHSFVEQLMRVGRIDYAGVVIRVFTYCIPIGIRLIHWNRRAMATYCGAKYFTVASAARSS